MRPTPSPLPPKKKVEAIAATYYLQHLELNSQVQQLS